MRILRFVNQPPVSYNENMKTLVLVRHGETVYNRMQLLQGSCDSPLTENGIKQAEADALWLKEKDFVFDHVYASSLKRAQSTLSYLSEKEMGIDAALNEMDLGSLEKESYKVLDFSRIETFFLDYGGEGADQVEARMRRFLTDIMNRDDHQSVLAVSSLLACRFFLRNVRNETGNEQISFANGTVYVLNYDGKDFFLTETFSPVI